MPHLNLVNSHGCKRPTQDFDQVWLFRDSWSCSRPQMFASPRALVVQRPSKYRDVSQGINRIYRLFLSIGLTTSGGLSRIAELSLALCLPRHISDSLHPIKYIFSPNPRKLPSPSASTSTSAPLPEPVAHYVKPTSSS